MNEGNEYWKLRTSHGRDKEYNAETFANVCNEYFKWCQDNPLKKEEAFHYQGFIKKTEVNLMRAFTIEGLCNFADICVKTFHNYCNLNEEVKDPEKIAKARDLLQVATRARQIIYNQKFEGAAANLLNSNIIARDLGLVDKIKDVGSAKKKKLTVEVIDHREKTKDNDSTG